MNRFSHRSGLGLRNPRGIAARRGLGGALACSLTTLACSVSAQTAPPDLTLTWRSDANAGSGSWNDPANWDPALLPDDFQRNARVTAVIPEPSDARQASVSRVRIDSYVTVSELLADAARDHWRPRVILGDDLRVMERVRDVQLELQDGKDLIFGGVGFGGYSPTLTEVRGVEIRNDPNQAFPQRIPRLTLNGPTRFSDTVIRDEGTPAGLIPLLMDGPGAMIVDGFNRVSGAVGLRPEGGLLVDGTLWLEHDRQTGRGGFVNTPIVMRGTQSKLVWNDAWQFVEGGSAELDLGGNTIRFESNATYSDGYSWPSRSFASSPALEFELWRLDPVPFVTRVEMADSLKRWQFDWLKDKQVRLQVSQSARLWQTGKDTGPATALDLDQSAITLAELRNLAPDPDQPGATLDLIDASSRFVLANGTIRGASEGDPVRPGERVGFLWETRIEGGLDVTGWINTDGPRPRVDTQFAGSTLVDGMLSAEGHQPLDEHDRVVVQIGELPEFRSFGPQTPNGTTTLRNSGIAENVHVRLFDEGVVEGNFRLDGKLALAPSDDNSTTLTFRGGVTIDGSGELVVDRDLLSGPPTSQILVEQGPITVGPHATINVDGASNVFLDAGEEDVTLRGVIRRTGLNGGNGLATLSAGKLRVAQGGTLAFERIGGRLDVDALVIEDGGRLVTTYLRNDNEPERPAYEVIGIAQLDGQLEASLANLGNGLGSAFQLGDVVTIIEAASVFGRFDQIAATTPTNTMPENSAWAVVYEATAVVAELALFGDANLNGQIEQGDLDAVLTNWGRNNVAIADPSMYVSWIEGDFDGDGIVAQADLDAVLTRWGSTTAPSFALNPALVPEPSVAVIGMATFGAGIGRHRRTLRR